MRPPRPWAVLALLLACGPGLARADILPPDSIPFPANATSESVVQAWIHRYLPTQGYVVGAWSANVVMLVSLDNLRAEAYPEVTTELLSQALTPEAANAAGWRAALQTETFACDRNQYKVVSSLYFARADRRGGFDQDSGDSVWRTPDSGATMDTVERTACFYGRRKHAAMLTPQPSASPAGAQAAQTVGKIKTIKRGKPWRIKRRKAKASAPKIRPAPKPPSRVIQPK
jgi:hypothetical protein